MARQYWLLKSEPNVYSIDDLAEAGTDYWEGVRNYQARNLMQTMRKGDLAFLYHSNAKPPGIAGVCEVARTAYPDSTAFDPAEKYYDPKSDPETPRWFMVDVRFKEKFSELIPLPVLKQTPGLEDMVLLNRSRLSVQPVTGPEWRRILRMTERG